jgi:hypothetical protein
MYFYLPNVTDIMQIQPDQHSAPCLRYSSADSIKFTYSSIQVSDVPVLTVRCKLVNFVFQILPLFIPEMSAGFTSYIFQIIPIYFTWIL